MQTVHTHKDEYPQNLYSRTPEEIIRERNHKYGCGCNDLAVEYLDAAKSGALCCTKCNTVYERCPGYDQVVTMFRGVDYYVDVNGTDIYWNNKKSSGNLVHEIRDDLYIVATRELPKSPKADLKVSKPVSNRGLYEEAYWKFVNAKTYDDAMYWKNQMEHHVDLALEPNGDNWGSWVKDPEVREEVKKKHFTFDPFYTLSALILMCCAIAQLLQMLGVV